MHQSFKKKILEFLEKENISIATLEKRADLKTNILRNVMYDRSKNPSLETILKLSNALQVSIDYLIRPDATNTTSHEDIFLSKEVFNYVTNWVIAHKSEIDMEKLFLICAEIYKYSKKVNGNSLDQNFAKFQLENYKNV